MRPQKKRPTSSVGAYVTIAASLTICHYRCTARETSRRVSNERDTHTRSPVGRRPISYASATDKISFRSPLFTVPAPYSLFITPEVIDRSRRKLFIEAQIGRSLCSLIHIMVTSSTRRSTHISHQPRKAVFKVERRTLFTVSVW